MQKIIIASFAALALSGTALAQDAAPVGTPEQPVSAQAGLDEAGFYVYQEGRQMLGSRLMGTDVWGADNEHIGNVDDLLINEDGDVIAIVVGIGGFLGIGTRDVAIATDQLDFVLLQDLTAPAGSAPTDPNVQTGAPVVDPTTGVAGTPDGGAVPQAQPSTGLAQPAQPGVGAGWNWTGAGIDRIQVNYTRAQLENAPEFTYAE